MESHTKLFIRLISGAVRPQWERSYENVFHGGPETLLNWLETQLGLPATGFHQADRITEYASALDKLEESLIAESMTADRWATASELLNRRDELLMAGWDEKDADALPIVVRELARTAEGKKFVFPSQAERLQRVIAALEVGQTLPEHCCHLFDTVDKWPVQWRLVFERLTVTAATVQPPQGPAGSTLLTAQSALMGEELVDAQLDQTFRYTQARSQSAAVEFIAATLSESPDKLATTVIYCEDDDLAVRLDACLNRIGLPTTGASVWSRAHPVLQILPLSVALAGNR